MLNGAGFVGRLAIALKVGAGCVEERENMNTLLCGRARCPASAEGIMEVGATENDVDFQQ